MFPGQNYVPHMLRGSPMENKILRTPGNRNTGLLDESSRKRKSAGMDQPAPISISTYRSSDPFGSHLQKGHFLGAQGEIQDYELNSNQRNTGRTNFMPQFDKNQFHYHNSYPRPLVTSNMNFLPNGNHNLGNAPFPPFQSSAYGRSFGSVNMQAAEGVARSTWKLQACDVVGARQSSESLNIEGVNDVAKYRFAQNELQFGGTRPFGVPSGEIFENRGQANGDGSVRAMEMNMGESGAKNLNYSLPGFSPISCSTPKYIETGQKNYSTCVSFSSEEKDKLDDGKASSTVAEKLWEGSLQLSSSVTVSSVAFFKSGEKLLNTNWYNSVEVKGKVRLEAFEKYIQDLPCSHNKGLMVISLCWKEGSPESGLKSMMEVARGYTKGKRVGFAHLSREIHLYICPQSKAIITILAKYGFFKGMAAIEDKQDSMIGCVIWRKGRTPSDSVSKKRVTKSAGPCKSSDEDSDLEDSPLTQLVQEIVAPLSATFTSTVQRDGENGDKGGNNSPSKTQIEVGDSLISAQGHENSTPSSHYIPQGDSTMVNNQSVSQFRTEQPKGNFNFQNPIIPCPKMVKKKRSFDDEDDDLPEFDFSAASKPSESETLGNRPPSPAVLKMDRTMQTGGPMEQANLLQIPAFTHLEKRDGIQNQISTNSVSNTVFPLRKNLFDDDDMPEWCPPEHHSRSSAGTIRPDTLSSKFPVSNFQNSPCGPPFSPRGLPSVGHFHTPQPSALRKGPSSEFGSLSDSVLRKPPGFNTKLPLDRTEKQGWGHS